MIEVKGDMLTVSGKNSELLTELAMIISAFLKKGIVDEEILNVVVGLAKAENNGNRKEYMKETIINLVNKKFEEIFKKDED